GKVAAVALDLTTDLRKLSLDALCGRKLRKRALGLAAGRRGFLAIGFDPRLRLGQGRALGSAAAQFTLLRSEAVARGVGTALQHAPARPSCGLIFRSGGYIGFRVFDRLPLVLDIAACCLQLGLDIGEPVLAGKAPRRTGRRIGGDRKAVPAPEIAF